MSATGELRRAGGLIDRFVSILSLGEYIDDAVRLIPLVKEWLSIEADWSTVPGIKARAAVLVAAGKIVAEATPNETDDALVAQFEALSQNDTLVDSIAWLISRFRAEVPGGGQAEFLTFVERQDVQQSLAERATAQAITMAEIMAAIKLIAELVTLLKGMFGGSAPTGGTSTGGGGLFEF